MVMLTLSFYFFFKEMMQIKHLTLQKHADFTSLCSFLAQLLTFMQLVICGDAGEWERYPDCSVTNSLWVWEVPVHILCWFYSKEWQCVNFKYLEIKLIKLHNEWIAQKCRDQVMLLSKFGTVCCSGWERRWDLDPDIFGFLVRRQITCRVEIWTSFYSIWSIWDYLLHRFLDQGQF